MAGDIRGGEDQSDAGRPILLAEELHRQIREAAVGTEADHPAG